MRPLAILLIGATVGGSAPSPQTALLRAQAEARLASNRAAQLEAQAQQATSRAARARAARRLAATRIAAAEAGISAATARLRIAGEQRAAQRARLAVAEQPTATLLAGLQTLARRPPVLALAQRGSLSDLVHTRALLASTTPIIAARTAGLRAELARAQAIEARANSAAAALRSSRVELRRQQARLAALEASTLRERQTYVDSALREGDRALALGEEVRAIVSGAQQRGQNAATLRMLAGVPGPRLRPGTGARSEGTRPAYLLPVEGRVLTGAGEISAAGVHARGTSIATAPGAPVVAPADGRVVYAAPFRSYGAVVILDHGGGWTTTLTGLRSLDVTSGDAIGRGDTIGAAPGTRPEITVELRQGGRPVPVASVL